jgi:hypothetical protein
MTGATGPAPPWGYSSGGGFIEPTDGERQAVVNHPPAKEQGANPATPFRQETWATELAKPARAPANDNLAAPIHDELPRLPISEDLSIPEFLKRTAALTPKSPTGSATPTLQEVVQQTEQFGDTAATANDNLPEVFVRSDREVGTGPDNSARLPVAKNLNETPAHIGPAPDASVIPPNQGEQQVQIEQKADEPLPRFDHEMALKFYHAIRPDGVVLGYRDGRPVSDANQFEQIAKEADSRGEHFFFAVAKLKPEWSNPKTHEAGRVTTPSKDKAINMPGGSKSHIHEHLNLPIDCDPEKYTGNDPVRAAQHYEQQGQRIKALLDKGLATLGIRAFAEWRSGAGWQGLIKLDRPITSEEYEELVGKLHIALGFDPVVRNCNRILRVPGSINWKNGKDGRVPSPCTPLFLTGVVTKVDHVRQALASIIVPEKVSSCCPEREIEIDWTQVKQPGWLQSVNDLPADAPAKLRHIVGHQGTLSELNEQLIDATLLQKPYGSWSEVTFALVAVLKYTGKYTPEQIAEALLAPLHCNQHIDRQADPHRAIERAISRSHNPQPEINQVLSDDVVVFEPGNEENCRQRLAQVVAADPNTYCLGRPTGPLVILRVPENSELPDGNAWGGDIPGTTLASSPDIMLRAERITWIRQGRKGNYYRSRPPRDFINDYLTQKQGLYGARPLIGIVRVPRIDDDGTIQFISGYDPQTGLFNDRPTTFDVSPKLSRDEARRLATEKLLYPFSLYRFEDPAAGKALLLAAMFTALERAFLPLAPMFVVRSSMPGTGKGLIVRGLTQLAFDTAPARATWGATGEEFEKRLGALLLQTPSAISFDNANGVKIKGDLLESILTEGSADIRPLGHSKIIRVQSRALMMLTGNNPIITGDMARRALSIYIVPKSADPERDYYLFDPVDYIRLHRNELLQTAFLIMKAYRLADMPQPNLLAVGSFNEWSRRVRDVVYWLTDYDVSEGFHQNKEEDPRRQNDAALLAALHQCFGTNPVKSATVIAKYERPAAEPAAWALRDALDEVLGSRQVNAKHFGYWAHRNAGVHNGGFILELKHDPHANSNVLTVRSAQSKSLASE